MKLLNICIEGVTIGVILYIMMVLATTL